MRTNSARLLDVLKANLVSQLNILDNMMTPRHLSIDEQSDTPSDQMGNEKHHYSHLIDQFDPEYQREDETGDFCAADPVEERLHLEEDYL